MSWQDFVDQVLMEPMENVPENEPATLDMAAIIGHDGSIWARTDSFPDVQPEEIEALLRYLDDPNMPSADLAAGGIKFGGKKFVFVGGEPTVPDTEPPKTGFLRGRTMGKGGCTVKKTLTAIVIGVYSRDYITGHCNVKVEELGEYLIGQGM